MKKKEKTRIPGKWSLIKMALAAGVALVLVKVFAPSTPPPAHEPATQEDCLESVYADNKNLRILEGSRTPANILHDLAPIICRGRKIFDNLKTEGEAIENGSVTLRMVVEFNGEIISAEIQETNINSRKFLKEFTRIIAMYDFTFWNREEEDAVFLYTASFGR